MFSMGWTLAGLTLLLEDLTDGSDRLKNTEPGMRRVVREVVIPEIDTNFMVGGRPSWDPMMDETLKRRGYSHTGSRMLIKTGLLLEEATSLENWTFGQDDAYFTLPDEARYGYFQETGFGFTPPRPFMTIPDDALERMDEIMNEWVQDGRE